METWQIMLGFQALTACLSLGVVLNFMFSKDILDNKELEAEKQEIDRLSVETSQHLTY